MTRPQIQHGHFTIERIIAAPPQRVYDAFATANGKAKWFTAPSGEWVAIERVFDFRIGGREILAGKWTSGMITRFDAVYFDIVPGERIIYTYDMYRDDQKLSVSLATVEIAAAADGARLRISEQGAFLDGYDDAGSRQRGTEALIDRVVASVLN